MNSVVTCARYEKEEMSYVVKNWTAQVQLKAQIRWTEKP